MSYILLLGLVVCSFVKKRSKVLYALLLGYAVIVFCFNTENPDLFNYTYHYMHGGRIMEPLYTLLEFLFRIIGADYIVLRIVLCVFGMALLTKTFWDFSPYPNVLFSLYLFYPFPLEVVQVRTFVANAIMVFSMRFIVAYYKDKERKNIFCFVAMLIVAICFHYSSLAFAILAVSFLNKKDKSMAITVIIIVMIVFCLNPSIIGTLLGIITGSANAARLVFSYNVVTPIQMFRLIATRALIILMLLIWQKVKSEKCVLVTLEGDTLNDMDINDFLLQCVLYISLYTVIEILFGGNFERINRVAIIFSMLLVTRQIKRAKKDNRLLMWSISTLAFTLNFFSVMLGKSTFTGAYINTVFRTVFENNLLF